MIHENSVVEDRVPVSGILRGSLLKDNGSGIKAICAGGGWARLDKSDVVIKGTRAEVDKAARALKEKGDEVEFDGKETVSPRSSRFLAHRAFPHS